MVLTGIAVIIFNTANEGPKNIISEIKYQKNTDAPAMKPHNANTYLFFVNFDIPFDTNASTGQIIQYIIHQLPNP